MDLAEAAKSLGQTVVNAAPFLGAALGTAFGGPAGTALGTLAGNALKKAFGVETDDPAALKAAIEQDPQAAAKLAMAELEFKMELQRMDNDLTKAFLSDVQSARDREVKVVQATGKKDLSTEVMAWLIILGFFTVLILRMCIQIEPGQTENVGMLIGCLITMTTTIVAYKWGSSRGSAEKSATISEAMRKGEGKA